MDKNEDEDLGEDANDANAPILLERVQQFDGGAGALYVLLRKNKK